MQKIDFDPNGVSLAVDWDSVRDGDAPGVVEVDVLVVDCSKGSSPVLSLGTAWERVEGKAAENLAAHLTDARKLSIDFRRTDSSNVVIGRVDKKGVQTLEKFLDSVKSNLPKAPVGFDGWWSL